MYRRFKTTSGKDILIGKSAEENDYLSIQDENISGDHIWMHVSGHAGSHLVLQECYTNVTEEELREAASLVAYYSKAKNLHIVKVHHCVRKNVSKWPNDPPGRVMIKDYKVIMADPEVGKNIVEREE